jgi:GNAT superfamily N-acetyltransferase
MAARIRPLDQPGDLGWVVMAHGEQYAQEFGWDTSFEVLVSQIVADYGSRRNPEREAAWIAELDGQRVGCIFCVASEGGDARLRILLVTPTARGLGVGKQLVDTCIDFARSAGYSRVVLWTNDPLAAARKIYLDRGFHITSEEPHESFGAHLIGQNYELDL